MWAGIGIVGAVVAISLTGVAASLFRADKPQREVRNWVIILGTQAQVTQRHFVDDYKMQSAYVMYFRGCGVGIMKEMAVLDIFPVCSPIPVKDCGTSMDLHVDFELL